VNGFVIDSSTVSYIITASLLFMSQNNYQPPLKLELHCSKRLILLMAVVHGLALIASLINNLPIFFKCVLLIMIVSHFYYQRKQLTSKQCRIEHNETGWLLAENNGFEDIQILPSTVISIVAIFLHFKINNHKQTLLIVSDALSEDDYRCLIVRLKTTLSGE
jgi:toxin CptA